ncbi:hypothetical protein [Brevibacillus laterosporus]|uniref:hypothetical protein n=1 Tax=Brevibacillus laterosporus TaxID=1465 RepID=UPI00264B0779|nr:hypothetical protein [Brevibacillus laterosporus]MDN9012130.1 hypothetical protein [Brevibacillus laterosporus]MDO0943226.1 hypothetical protein [Brevibacillus laterosporus]
MQYCQLFEKYQEIRSLTQDYEAWMNSSIGGDLWIDGLEVFLTIEPADFESTFKQFVENYTYDSHSFIRCLTSLHQFTVDCAKESEFELYKALALGMTWLSFYPHYQSDFFNLSGRITNHSIALLLSPTYQAMWITSYNEGLTLYIADKANSHLSLFRPENGLIYQNHQYFIRTNYVNFPYQSYFHEMAHILFCYNLYAHVLADENEKNNYLSYVEEGIVTLEKMVLSELVAVRDNLHVIHDGFNGSSSPEFREYSPSVIHGDISSISASSLKWFTKAYMQVGTENSYTPNNSSSANQLIVASQPVAEEKTFSLAPPCQPHIENIKQHCRWTIRNGAYNHISAYREVIELMAPDLNDFAKVQKALHPSTYSASQISKESLPEPDSHQREQKKQLWRWREAYARLAEIRGYIEMEAPLTDAIPDIQRRLLIVAKRNAHYLNTYSPKDKLSKNHTGEIMSVENMLKEIRIILCGLRHTATRELLLSMFDEPFMPVLETS